MGSSEAETDKGVLKPAGAPARPKSRALIAIGIVIILIVAAVLGAWALGAFNPKPETVLTVAMSSDVETMDPAKTSAM